MGEVFEPALLPDDEKRDLCERLLREFGVTRWRVTSRGELIHSCPIPGAHKNGDRNPSAAINYKKLTFNCLSCRSHGGLLWFIGVCRGGEDISAVRDWLAGETGTGGHVMELARLLEILDAIAAPATAPPPMPSFAPQMLAPWTKWSIPHPYLTDAPPDGRGCHPDTLSQFHVGYAEEYFMGRHVPTQERIVIPVFWRGELVGWQARRLAPWDEPKYKSSVDFPRDRVVFNYHGFLEAVVVESPLSVLRHHHHVPTMVSTLGAEVTEIQRRLLHRYPKIVLWFDNDEAGWGSTLDLGGALLPYCDVWAVQSPWAADPADLPDSTVEQMIMQAVPFVVWERPKALTEWSA